MEEKPVSFILGKDVRPHPDKDPVLPTEPSPWLTGKRSAYAANETFSDVRLEKTGEQSRQPLFTEEL